MPAPTIQTSRLILRAHRLEDFESCAALWADPAVTRYIGGRPFSREESWTRLLRYAGHWSLLGYGYWVAEEKSTARYAGELGFANLQREMKPSLANIPEAGWVFTPAFHGQGLATEGVQAILRWADQNFATRRTACIIDPANAPSLRLAARIGYREWARTTYKGNPTVVFARDA